MALSILMITIFLLTGVVQWLSFVKAIRYYLSLKNKNIKLSNWTSWDFKKDLRKISNSPADEEVKQNAARLLKMHERISRVFFTGFFLLCLLFISNGFFKWKE